MELGTAETAGASSTITAAEVERRSGSILIALLYDFKVEP